MDIDKLCMAEAEILQAAETSLFIYLFIYLFFPAW